MEWAILNWRFAGGRRRSCDVRFTEAPAGRVAAGAIPGKDSV
jgi:hypothetical protein